MREKEDLKSQLISAATELLRESGDPTGITSRQIAAAAGTNAAMINYYFGSKDELLTEAVGKMIESEAEWFYSPPDSMDSPKKTLRKILLHLSQMVLHYRRFSKIFIPHILLEDEIVSPVYLLPLLRKHFGTEKSEVECRVIAYQMISFLQLVFYRSDAFLRYAGINLFDESACETLIDLEMDLFLPEERV
ncbi:TetR/AcrR family transcriptional regulator [Caproicibacter sp.]|uniref:TetR/AcrR family transcriptional regulator n=1 Tax=Caproicibacter sp. TaxID=2814884 RepID=UPI003988DA59